MLIIQQLRGCVVKTKTMFYFHIKKYAFSSALINYYYGTIPFRCISFSSILSLGRSLKLQCTFAKSLSTQGAISFEPLKIISREIPQNQLFQGNIHTAQMQEYISLPYLYEHFSAVLTIFAGKTLECVTFWTFLKIYPVGKYLFRFMQYRLMNLCSQSSLAKC